MTLKLVACFLIVISTHFSLNVKNNISQVKEVFMLSFNTSSYENLYALFDDPLKSRNPPAKLRSKLESLKKQTGIIQKMEIRQSKGNVHTFWSYHNYLTLEITFELNDNGTLTKFLIANPTPVEEPKLSRNTTKMSLPFEGEWFVFWGGTTVSENYHVADKTQQGAYDFVIKDKSGSLYKNAGRTNEDYYAWGKNIIAPCEAKVVRIIEGVKDNMWPRMNKRQPYGNAIILETNNKEYILLAHLMYNSIKVKMGQRVSQGQILGLCGNSGNSTDPHLHFSIQNRPELGIATGAKCYFDQLYANDKIKQDYIPVRGQRIKNL